MRPGREAVICWYLLRPLWCVSHYHPPCSRRSVTTLVAWIYRDECPKVPPDVFLTKCTRAAKGKRCGGYKKCWNVCALQSRPMLLMGDDTLCPDRSLVDKRTTLGTKYLVASPPLSRQKPFLTITASTSLTYSTCSKMPPPPSLTPSMLLPESGQVPTGYYPEAFQV